MPEWLLQFLTIILGAGGVITAIAAWRKDAKKAPVEAQTAQIADAVAISHAAAGMVELQDKRNAAQDAKIDKLIVEINLIKEELFGWRLWYTGDLVANWREHREKEEPPPPPAKQVSLN